MAFKIGVFIGRFQICHSAHLKALESALESVDYLFILIGSSFRARTIRNPFTFEERKNLLTLNLNSNLKQKIKILPLEDQMYNESKWAQTVENIINKSIDQLNINKLNIKNPNLDIILFGHDKDHSTYYLKNFPNWGLNLQPSFGDIDASSLRKIYFNNPDLNQNQKLKNILSHQTIEWLKIFSNTEDYFNLKTQFDYIEKYKNSFSSTPYPVIFTTTDVCLEYQGKILLIQRKGPSGKNLWAMPGGFLEINERIEAGLFRELIEETGITKNQNININFLKEHLKSIQVFDHPERSQIGRVITHCGYIVLPDNIKNISIWVDDDAVDYQWVKIENLNHYKTQLHDDHYYILKKILKLD